MVWNASHRMNTVRSAATTATGRRTVNTLEAACILRKRTGVARRRPRAVVGRAGRATDALAPVSPALQRAQGDASAPATRVTRPSSHGPSYPGRRLFT